MEGTNIDVIRSLLEDEVRGDVVAALKKLDPAYSMTWVYRGRDGVLFPRTRTSDIQKELEDVYTISGREYKIRHILAHGDVVVAELVESYPDPSTPSRVHRTPMMLIWELKDGKVRAGRHYCDPALSYMNLTEQDVERIWQNN